MCDIEKNTVYREDEIPKELMQENTEDTWQVWGEFVYICPECGTRNVWRKESCPYSR
jgi:hypothetical protein